MKSLKLRISHNSVTAVTKCVILLFPVAHTAKGRHPHSQLEPSTTLMLLTNIRILCTDDNAETRELLCLMLEYAGYSVVCVGSGQEALNKLRVEEFDLIVLDNWMPTMIGTEVAKLIREFNQTIPIVFYSAASYEEDKQAAFDAGADAYLTKPLGVDLLLGEVERLLPPVH